MKLHQSVWDYTSKIKEKSCDDDDDDMTMEIEIETKEEKIIWTFEPRLLFIVYS